MEGLDSDAGHRRRDASCPVQDGGILIEVLFLIVGEGVFSGS